MLRRCVAMCAVVASACTGASAADASVDLTRDIRGDFIDRYTLPDGSVLEGTLDVTTLTVAAFVELPDGGFETHSTTGVAGGQFVIRDVPQGRYSLAAAATVIDTDQRVTHFGQNRLGRPYAQAANPGEGYRITATHLAPWSADDELQFFSWSAGIGFFSTSQRDFSDHRPDAGSESLQGAFIDFGGINAPETPKGDTLTLTQLHAQTLDSGVLVKTAARTVTVQKSLLVGTATPLTVDFADPPLDSVTLSLQRDAFVRFVAAQGPGAQLFSSRMALSAHPGSFEFTTSDGTPDLALAEFPLDAGVTSVTASFGTVYGAEFSQYLSGGIASEVNYALPVDGGSSLPRSEVATVSSIVTRAQSTGALAPLISPLRTLTLDGIDALGSTAVSCSLTPVLTWAAPSVGTLTRTDIDVLELSVSPQTGGTNRLLSGSIRVLGNVTRFHVPPGVFVAGRTYVLRVTAVFAPSFDPQAPLRQVAPPVGTATVLTQLITPRP